MGIKKFLKKYVIDYFNKTKYFKLKFENVSDNWS